MTISLKFRPKPIQSYVKILQLYAKVHDPNTCTDIFVPVDRYDAVKGTVKI